MAGCDPHTIFAVALPLVLHSALFFLPAVISHQLLDGACVLEPLIHKVLIMQFLHKRWKRCEQVEYH